MTHRILEVKDQLNASLYDSNKPWTGVLANLEKKTNINRLYLFIGIIVSSGLWLAFGYAAQLICNIIGFLYPAYASMHALESPCKDDDTKWLTYWVVFAVFCVFDYFSNTIVGWFPLYWLIKCIFFVWLMLPIELNGSLIIYNKIIRPYFLKHSSKVDETIHRVKQQAAKLLEKEK